MKRANRETRPRLLAGLFCGALLVGLCCAGAVAAAPGRRANTARTSRWWKLSCSDVKTSPCRFTVHLRGRIDRSRLRLFEEALRRRADAERALGRRVDLAVDANTHGGEIFAAMEIGRLLRRESASIDIPPGAECSSACVFVLMGATSRSVARSARVGIHRPSLGDASSDALVDSMSTQIVLYAEQMQVPKRIIDKMMLIPTGRMHYLTLAELADWVVLTGKPRSR